MASWSFAVAAIGVLATVHQGAAQTFTVTAFSTGSTCIATDGGRCFTIGDATSGYGRNERCSITYTGSTATLSVATFATACRGGGSQCDDILTIGGVQYAGTQGPNGVLISGSTAISWGSDGSQEAASFTVCANTFAPTAVPTTVPTTVPTGVPSTSPTRAPTTTAPTASPTDVPTGAPSNPTPTDAPQSASPTVVPTSGPTAIPTDVPSTSPTRGPTTAPPTESPTDVPSGAPTTATPTDAPVTAAPTVPTPAPTSSPTGAPIPSALTVGPTPVPTTSSPTGAPTASTGSPIPAQPTPTVSAPTGAPTAPTGSPMSAQPATATPTTAQQTTPSPTLSLTISTPTPTAAAAPASGSSAGSSVFTIIVALVGVAVVVIVAVLYRQKRNKDAEEGGSSPPVATAKPRPGIVQNTAYAWHDYAAPIPVAESGLYEETDVPQSDSLYEMPVAEANREYLEMTLRPPPKVAPRVTPPSGRAVNGRGRGKFFPVSGAALPGRGGRGRGTAGAVMYSLPNKQLGPATSAPRVPVFQQSGEYASPDDFDNDDDQEETGFGFGDFEGQYADPSADPSTY